MRYKDNNGRLFKSETPTGLVMELYKTSWQKDNCRNATEWLKGCADRIHEQYDIEIDFNSATTFVNELKRIKLIEEIH